MMPSSGKRTASIKRHFVGEVLVGFLLKGVLTLGSLLPFNNGCIPFKPL